MPFRKIQSALMHIFVDYVKILRKQHYVNSVNENRSVDSAFLPPHKISTHILRRTAECGSICVV